MATGENRFVYADAGKCVGCKSCELACGMSHDDTDLYTAVQEKRTIQSRTAVVQVGNHVTPLQCRQCENAPCIAVCPVSALYQDGGMVKLNEPACIGCKLCSMVCPFGAIRMGVQIQQVGKRTVKKAKPLKCDLCVSRTGKIEAAACACIQACPTQAMFLVDMEERRKSLMTTRGREIITGQGQ